jgi:hypothetical protein
MERETEITEWLNRYGSTVEEGGRGWRSRFFNAKEHDAFIREHIAPSLTKLGIEYFYELSYSGTCYLCAKGVKIRLSDHEIDHVNYDLQILFPGASDVQCILNYILKEELRAELLK